MGLLHRALRGKRVFSVVAFMAAVMLLSLVFHGGVTSNPASRALTVLAVVENGTLYADPFRDITIDRALVNGHFYSDKAPLTSFVVIPFFFVWRHVARHPLTHADIQLVVFLGDVVAAALPFAAFTALLWIRASRSPSDRVAVWLALVGAFGTSVFPYAGMYLGHVLAGALFVFAYDAATHDDEPHGLTAGVLSGLAVLAELPMAIPVGVLGVWIATRGWKALARYVSGGAPSALVACAYNAAITGSPFDPPYHYVAPQFFPPWGRTFALDAQAAHAARMLLFSEYRGVLVYAPALVVLFPLAVWGARTRDRAALVLGLTLAQFGFVASFFMWAGGWAIGPRHLIPVIMLVTYAGLVALAKTPRARPWFLVTGSMGLGLNVVAAATNPFVEGFLHPIRDLYWPAFVHGTLTPHTLFAWVGWDGGRACVGVWLGLFVLTGLAFARLPAPRST